MKPKIFLDCGFYDGIALEQYYQAGIVDKSWTIYAWEPLPDFDLKLRLERIPLKIQMFKKAVWTKTAKVNFDKTQRQSANYILGTRGDLPAVGSSVPAINFSAFVAKLPEAYIICNMDIEGAEYPVLEKLIADGTIDKINLLDIEFHHRFMNNKDMHDSQALVDQLIQRGVAVRIKVPFE